MGFSETLTVDDGQVNRLASRVARNLGNIWSSAISTCSVTAGGQIIEIITNHEDTCLTAPFQRNPGI